MCDAPKFRVTCKQMVLFIQLLHAPKGPWTELHCLHYTYSTLQHVLAVPLKLSLFLHLPSLSSFALNFFFHHHFSSFSFLFCIACFDSDFLVPSVSKSPTPPFLSNPILFTKALFGFVLASLFSLFSLSFSIFFQLKHPLCNLLKLLLSPVFSLSLSVSLISGFALHISERRNTNEGWNLNSHFWISEYSFFSQFQSSFRFSGLDSSRAFSGSLPFVCFSLTGFVFKEHKAWLLMGFAQNLCLISDYLIIGLYLGRVKLKNSAFAYYSSGVFNSL